MPKTADEIHERGQAALGRLMQEDTSGQLVALLYQSTLMLEEIAAQLAEMNQRERDKLGY